MRLHVVGCAGLGAALRPAPFYRMKVRVLGCSGGIGASGGQPLRTTSMLVDSDILVDAGTGVAELSLAELAAIDHVFVTHTHLDHIACLPLISDSVGDMRGQPLVVHVTAESLAILREHLFNDLIWPDFTELPSPGRAFVRLQEIGLGQTTILGGRRITALPASHTVPAVGYHLDSGSASLVYSGDTHICDAFWRELNKIDNLRYLIMESAFSDSELQLATVSRHLCPTLLASELAKWERRAELFITHLKPGSQALIMQEIEALLPEFQPRMLADDYVFDL